MMNNIFYLVCAAALILSGCAHAVSPNILKESDPKLSFTELQLDPLAHMGKIMVLGGVIVETSGMKDGTLIEIYQTATDSRGKPVDTDISKGRFMVFHPEVLDPGIYRSGRKVTVAARVEGDRKGRIGEALYMYPYLTALEIHLWEERFRYQPYPRTYRDPWSPGLSPYHRDPFHRHPW